MEHFCDRCGWYIYPGQHYERFVWRVEPVRIEVMKMHIDCPPENFPEEFLEVIRDLTTSENLSEDPMLLAA
ncbi:MAG: hypothetical protein V4644_00980 [Patescibacteria group bacterium]